MRPCRHRCSSPSAPSSPPHHTALPRPHPPDGPPTTPPATASSSMTAAPSRAVDSVLAAIGIRPNPPLRTHLPAPDRKPAPRVLYLIPSTTHLRRTIRESAHTTPTGAARLTALGPGIPAPPTAPVPPAAHRHQIRADHCLQLHQRQSSAASPQPVAVCLVRHPRCVLGHHVRRSAPPHT